MLENLSPADRAAVEDFCRELAFALRRILGEAHDQTPIDLVQPIPSDQPVKTSNLRKDEKHETDEQPSTAVAESKPHSR